MSLSILPKFAYTKAMHSILLDSPPCFVFFIWELHWHFQEITATFARNRRRTHNQQRKKYMMKMNLWPINYLPADAESLSNDTINSTFTAQYVSFVRRFAASVYSSISPIHMNSTRSQIHEIRNGGNHLFSVAGFFFRFTSFLNASSSLILVLVSWVDDYYHLSLVL